MSALGPDLPPHLLAKRKRREEEEDRNEPAIASGALRSPSPHEKRPRVIGPAMPPAPLDERPTEPPEAEGSDSDEDDDFGPALPNARAGSTVEDVDKQDSVSARPALTASADKPKRDDWMMLPPQQDDLAARLDPSKPRARGFNTGKGAKGPRAGLQDNSSWHETPEQKQKRLQDEMMGISKADTAASGKPARPIKSAKDEAAAARQTEQVERSRGPSLMEQHKQSKGAEAEDDPSKRAFDRDKDMASGSRISGAQKSEMLKKGGGFSSKFSGGSYL
ncbi:hypothetical protein EJ03DRAFT_212887 [Teratosphaeria nubilosa]|uniref:DUF3752 domain-containing protein n=1 Tax=Teratosphaeria nubilosa TaxID=161662 RepID=A0A6G1LHQ2_9PEZI|nr:hypothetical protein EJ03DRAFT_212887 [Teratosphaeria nubilosa]